MLGKDRSIINPSNKCSCYINTLSCQIQTRLWFYSSYINKSPAISLNGKYEQYLKGLKYVTSSLSHFTKANVIIKKERSLVKK